MRLMLLLLTATLSLIASADDEAIYACDTTLENVTPKCSWATDGKCEIKIKKPSISYPIRALEEKVDGCVSIVFDITKDGVADNFRIIKESPAGYGFALTALQSLMKREYPSNKEVKDWKALFRFDHNEHPTIHETVRNFRREKN